MVNVVALCVAALSAVGFAVSNALQHHANTALDDDLSRPGILAALLRQPWWVLGQLLALTAFSLHALALHLGLLVLVQPVVVSGIVLAVPIRAALERRLPSWAEVGTVTLTAGGLALFLVASRPLAAQTASPIVAMGVTAVGIVLAFGAARWAGRRRGVPQAAGYGLGAGVLFGLTAGLVKLAGVDAAAAGGGFVGHLTALLTAWPAWAVVAVGVTGVVLNQRSYRAGPLSASMPLLNTVNVLIAIMFGVLVFGEVPDHNATALVGEAAAITLMVIGLRRLAREPVLEPAETAERSLAPTA